jgi:hypothetical protein
VSRFIIYYPGTTEPPEGQLRKLEKMPDLRILEKEPPRLILVETESRTIEQLRAGLPGWVVAQEALIPPPD